MTFKTFFAGKALVFIAVIIIGVVFFLGRDYFTSGSSEPILQTSTSTPTVIIGENLEGEADPSRMSLGMKKWIWISALYNDGHTVTPRTSDTFTLSFSPDGTFSATTDCNNLSGSYAVEQATIVFGPITSTRIYCEASQEEVFIALLQNTAGYHFTSRGHLILDLKFDSGSVTFR